MKLGERKVFEFLPQILHADTACERRIDVQSFLRNAQPLLAILDMMQCPHIMQAVRELDQEDADVVRHRKQELAEVLGLLGALGEEFEF